MILHTYQITVKDDFFDVELTGEFYAVDEAEALEMAADHYSHSLGTTLEAIEVVNCKQIF